MLHGWAGLVGLPLGMVEGLLLWSCVAHLSPLEVLKKLGRRGPGQRE